jgi:hypothetical protein
VTGLSAGKTVKKCLQMLHRGGQFGTQAVQDAAKKPKKACFSRSGEIFSVKQKLNLR